MSRNPLRAEPTHTGRNERGRRVVLCLDPHDGRFLTRNEIKARYAGATREWGTYTEIRTLTDDEARDLLDEKLLRTLRRLRALGDDGVSHDDLDLPIEQLRVKFRWILERFAADPDWLNDAMRRMSQPGWAAEAAKNAVVTEWKPPGTAKRAEAVPPALLNRLRRFGIARLPSGQWARNGVWVAWCCDDAETYPDDGVAPGEWLWCAEPNPNARKTLPAPTEVIALESVCAYLESATANEATTERAEIVTEIVDAVNGHDRAVAGGGIADDATRDRVIRAAQALAYTVPTSSPGPGNVAGWFEVTRSRDVIRAQRNRAEDQLTSALRTLRSVLNEAGGIDGRLKDDPVSVQVRAEIEDILSLLSGGVKDASVGELS